ncbi:hypothetical protein [Jiangella endophytica]|nr:hypothetical protein [Jiangella endophytica]
MNRKSWTAPARIGEALGVRQAIVDIDYGVIEISTKAAFRMVQGGVLDE